MARNSCSGFSFSFLTRGISHFTTATQNTIELVEGRTNEQQGLGSAPSARKGVCRLSRACIFCETSTKDSNNADFCWLCHSLDSQLKADRSPVPSDVNCISPSSFVNWPCVFSGPKLSSYTSDTFLLMGQIELKSVLMLNWTTWKITVLIFNMYLC